MIKNVTVGVNTRESAEKLVIAYAILILFAHNFVRSHGINDFGSASGVE